MGGRGATGDPEANAPLPFSFGGGNLIPSLTCGGIKCASGACSGFLFLFQKETDELQLAAGKTLVTLAGTFYKEVMYELQSHVGIMELPPLFILLTLGSLASAYGTASLPCFWALTGIREGGHEYHLCPMGPPQLSWIWGPRSLAPGSQVTALTPVTAGRAFGMGRSGDQWGRSPAISQRAPPPSAPLLHLGMAGPVDAGLPYAGGAAVGFLGPPQRPRVPLTRHGLAGDATAGSPTQPRCWV